MPLFQPVILEWKGKQCVIPADGLLRCIAEIEDVFTLGELATVRGNGRLPLAKISEAFAIALKHGGAAVSAEDVYAEMFAGGGKALRRVSMSAIIMLQKLMIPPAHLAEPPEKPEKKASGARRGAPSKQRTGSS